MEPNTIWEQMASRYDTEDRVAIANIIVQAVRSELEKTTDTKEKTALDFGCGTGLIGLGLIDLFQSVLLTDTSPQMIEQVNRKIEYNHITSARTQCCDFLAETPPALQVDYIILSQVLLHIKNSERILTRLYNMLKIEGHLLIVDFDKNKDIHSDQVHAGFEQRELLDLVKQIGFTSANSHTFYHGEKIFMNKDASMFLLNATK